jgi:polysaccharide export outer membrane protein
MRILSAAVSPLLGLSITLLPVGIARAQTPVATSIPALPAQPYAPQVFDEDYLLGPGDVLSVAVFNVPEYSGEQQVLANGTLNLPAIGQVSVSGLTLPEAELRIERQYQAELRRPQITLNLIQPRPLRVAIAGEVEKPGLYTLSVDGQFPGLFQALQQAGGVTQAADLRQVSIQRRVGQGGTQRIPTNLFSLIQSGDLSQDIALRDGDSITIPATAAIEIGDTALIALSNLATDENQAVQVAIVGEVNRPGTYVFDGSTATSTNASTGRRTLTQALRLAGGLKPMANIREVKISRTTRVGEEQEITLNLWELIQDGEFQQDLILQTGDTIFIPVLTAAEQAEIAQVASTNLAPDTIQIGVIGEAKNAGSLALPANTTLNQAILAAGGLDNTRASTQIDLLRLNPDGSVAQRTITVDFTQGMNAENNPILMNNDILVVRRNTSASWTDAIATIINPLRTLVGAPFVTWGNFFDIGNSDN